jgi:tetratricopeptide (TPR) repeat protein
VKTRCSSCRAIFSFEGLCPYCGRQLTPSEGDNLFWVLRFVLAVFAFSAAAILFFFLHGGQPISLTASSALMSPASIKINVAPPAQKIVEQYPLTLGDMAKIRNLFLSGQFETLTRMAGDIQRNFKTDPLYEYKIAEFFYVFATPVPGYEKLLNEWVKSDPTGFAPYLARACYLESMAWHSRGYRYASATSDKQFEQMHYFFEEASTDALASLAIDPDALPAYFIRLDILKADGSGADSEALSSSVFRKAQSRFPHSFLLYYSRIQSKLPRWGGSYPEAEKIAMDAYGHIHENPALYMLFGEIYADRASVLAEQKEYDKAIAVYDKAISYGDFYNFFLGRAQVYRDLKQYEKALKDLDRGIELCPREPFLYRSKATVLLYQGNVKSALDVIGFLEAQLPGEPEADQWRSWAAGYLIYQGSDLYKKNLEQAAAKFNMALEVKPDDGDAYYWRGITFLKLHKNDQARSDIEQSIKYNPNDFKSYRVLDYLLSAQQKWDEILDNWNKFLVLEPNKAEAYLERAGTYKHKGDMKSALLDLKQACDLGNPKACMILKKYRP